MTAQLPTLPGMVDGIVGHDLLGWTVQCRQCGDTATGPTMLTAMRGPKAIRFAGRPGQIAYAASVPPADMFDFGEATA